MRSPAPGAGPHLHPAGRRLPGNLDLAQESWERAVWPGLAWDPDTHAGAAAGGIGGWARGLRPLTMVETRFSKFLQKLGFSGGSHQYEPLERGELETLVSLAHRAQDVGTDPPPYRTPPQNPVGGQRAALLPPALLPLIPERSCLHSNSCSLVFLLWARHPGRLALRLQPILWMRN